MSGEGGAGRVEGRLRSSATGHLRAHGGALAVVGAASLVGALAAFAFQIITARYLGPAEFGLLAAFFSIVNVAAIGSSSLQNAVTVETARELDAAPGGRRRPRVPRDALVIGLVSGAVVAAASPFLATALDADPTVVLAAAACIPLSFLFADALGLIQGTGDARGAVLWSTGSLLVRILLVVVAAVVGLGLGGVVGAVVAATAVAVVGAMWAARRIPRPVRGVFSTTGIAVVLLTLAFAWLTSADVFFVRAMAPAGLAGEYASVAVLVKAAFLLPATLSIYLLPRFVRHRDDTRMLRTGAIATLVLSAATGLLLVAFFAIAGPLLVSLLYGSEFDGAATLLVPTAIAYAPWIAAQGLLILMTSTASRPAVIVLVAVAAVQGALFAVTLPDVHAMLVVMGVLGCVVLAVFLGIGSRHTTARTKESR